MESNKDTMLEICKSNSIGKDKVTKLKYTKRKIAAAVLTAAIASFSVVGLTGCSTADIFAPQEISQQLSVYETMAYNEMTYYNIPYYSSTGEEINNDVSDYKKIENLSEENLIGYYYALGEKECEKVVQALGYNDWNDFLIKNHCYDENGNPSIEAWKMQVRSQIAEQYKEKVKQK